MGQVVRSRDTSGREIKRRCQPAALPKDLPAADALLDSAAAIERLTALGLTDSSFLVSLLFKDGGVSVAALEPTPPGVRVGAAVFDAIGQVVRDQKGPPVWAVRVRARLGGQPGLTVERSVYCPPEPVPTRSPPAQRIMVQASPGDRRPPPFARIHIDTECTIAESGVVTEVRLIRASGIRELDDEVVRTQYRREFRPALLDGVPVPSWYRRPGQWLRL